MYWISGDLSCWSFLPLFYCGVGCITAGVCGSWSDFLGKGDYYFVGGVMKPWNVLFFFLDDEGNGLVETWNIQAHDLTLNVVATVDEKIPCHVCLISKSKTGYVLDQPFTSHFFAPDVYAEHLLQSNFMGVIIKDSPFGTHLMDKIWSLLHRAILRDPQKIDPTKVVSELS